jgi:hypothetical protein
MRPIALKRLVGQGLWKVDRAGFIYVTISPDRTWAKLWVFRPKTQPALNGVKDIGT